MGIKSVYLTILRILSYINSDEYTLFCSEYFSREAKYFTKYFIAQNLRLQKKHKPGQNVLSTREEECNSLHRRILGLFLLF